VLCLLGAFDAYLVGRTLLDPGRLGRATAEALSTASGSTLVARQVTAALDAQAAANGVALPAGAPAVVARSVATVLARQRSQDLLARSLAGTYRGLLDGGDAARVPVDLGPLAPALRREIARTDPQSAALVARAQIPVVHVDGGSVAPALARVGEAHRVVDEAPLPLAMLGAALLVAAIVVARDRRGVLRGSGFAILCFAVLPAAIWLLVPRLAARGGGVGTPAVRRGIADSLVSGYGPAAALTAAAGLLLVAISFSLPRR
jgi:hypothetical protein